ncbi:hypothetical protein M5K25_013302 [Dendrobium thyrsiflorum]|uniref:Uncharacterized protein n=1 Tax=Dendrobium thyrsiflorum TaxID=117978 RepID=A0ABD0USQ2_DENTH
MTQQFGAVCGNVVPNWGAISNHVNTIIHLRSVATVALNAIYGTYCCTKALVDNTMNIIHPKPEGRLEGNDNIIGDGLGRFETVKTNIFTSKGVVVVPSDLKWAAAIVLLTRCAWILGVVLVTVKVRFVHLFYVAKVYTK